MKNGILSTKHCGGCRETGHSLRTCPGAIEASRTRVKEVTDQVLGKDNEKDKVYNPARSNPRIIEAHRGPKYIAGRRFDNYKFAAWSAAYMAEPEVFSAVA